MSDKAKAGEEMARLLAELRADPHSGYRAAAGLIESQAAEIARLREEISVLRKGADELVRQCYEYFQPHYAPGILRIALEKVERALSVAGEPGKSADQREKHDL